MLRGKVFRGCVGGDFWGVVMQEMPNASFASSEWKGVVGTLPGIETQGSYRSDAPPWWVNLEQLDP